jgi:hypothetical protein
MGTDREHVEAGEGRAAAFVHGTVMQDVIEDHRIAAIDQGAHRGSH